MTPNKEVVDFLEQKGSIVILVAIGQLDSTRHKDLKDEILNSSSTLYNRLEKGAELGLWEQSLRNRQKHWALTDSGSEIYDKMDVVAFYTSYEQMKQRTEELDQHKELLLQEIEGTFPDPGT